jgi:hypothetical protein
MQGSYTMVTITSWWRRMWRRGAGDALSGNAPRCPCSEHGDVVVLAPPLLAYQKRSPPSSHLLRKKHVCPNKRSTHAVGTPAPGGRTRRGPRAAWLEGAWGQRSGWRLRFVCRGLSSYTGQLSSYCRVFCRVVDGPSDRGQGSRGRSQVRRGRPHSDGRPLGVGSLVGTGAHWRGRAHASVSRFGSSGS